MNKGGKGKKSPRKVFVCVNCEKEFTVPYIGCYSEKIIKNCSECMNVLRKNNITKERDLDELYNNFKKVILKLYNKFGTFTVKDILAELSVSPKTLTKMYKHFNTNLGDECIKLGIELEKGNKFQRMVLVRLHEIFPDTNIASEKTFEDLVNQDSGARLRIDFYIEKFKLAIECDGMQHSDKHHFFNKLNDANGFITPFQSDKIKEKYCELNGIKIIRILYTQKQITKEYVMRALSEIDLGLGNPEA